MTTVTRIKREQAKGFVTKEALKRSGYSIIREDEKYIYLRKLSSVEWNSMHDFQVFVSSLTNEQLGSLIREYIEESNHNSWDGHPDASMSHYLELFKDIKTYHEHK